MTAPLVLLGYALVVGTLVTRWLASARWPQRSPAVGILLWQALSASMVLAVALAGVAVALPSLPLTTDLAELLHACALAVQSHYATPGGATVAAAGALVAVVVPARVAYCFTAGWSVARRRRLHQRQELALVAHRHAGIDALVVPHGSPAVYCMPGRGGAVVLTSATLADLTDPEVSAVLAHERAHLRGRHDLVLAAADALSAAFPFVPMFDTARAHLARLVEMHADDAALAESNRKVLATALVAVAAAAHPVGTLGAGGGSALARVRRLSAPAEPLSRVGWTLGVVAAVAVVVFPLVVVTAPALAAAAMDYCPVDFPVAR